MKARYRFSFGNSNTGPIGGVIVVTGEYTPAEALLIANEVLDNNYDGIEVRVEKPGVEYFNVYCAPKLTLEDLEESEGS